MNIQLAMPLACQHEYRIKNSSCQSQFEPAPAIRTHPEQSFQRVLFALSQNQIEDAWSMWSKTTEECLMRIPASQSSTGSPGMKPGKGKVRFRRQRVFPKEFAESATTLEIVRWSKVMRQLQELNRLTFFGQRAVLTWKNVQKHVALTRTHVQHAETVRQIAENNLTLQHVQAMSRLIPTILATIQYEEQKARIRNWKQRMQTSKRSLHKWLKKGQEVSSGVILNDAGEATANKDEIFAAITNAWDGIFNKFASSSPPLDPFIETFGPTMKSAPCQLEPLTGERLRASLREVKQTSGGLDSWNANGLKALSAWFPECFASLAEILNHIETHGTWPNALAAGYTTMLPKPGGPAMPGPKDMRPISVRCRKFFAYGLEQDLQIACLGKPPGFLIMHMVVSPIDPLSSSVLTSHSFWKKVHLRICLREELLLTLRKLLMLSL